MMKTDVLDEVVAQMRRLGIQRFRDGDTEIALWPAKVAPEAPPEAPEVTDDDDLCNCGHDADTHMGGLCVEGCLEETCRKRRE